MPFHLHYIDVEDDNFKKLESFGARFTASTAFELGDQMPLFYIETAFIHDNPLMQTIAAQGVTTMFLF